MSFVSMRSPGPLSTWSRSPRDELDVAVPGSIESVLGGREFQVLVNCAAWTGVDEAEDNAMDAFAVNAHAVQAMARVCARKGARFVHVSTDYVFGGDRALRRPLREDDPMAPVNVYGASKAMGETLARLESDDVVILRVASLFGVAGGERQGRQLRRNDDPRGKGPGGRSGSSTTRPCRRPPPRTSRASWCGRCGTAARPGSITW